MLRSSCAILGIPTVRLDLRSPLSMMWGCQRWEPYPPPNNRVVAARHPSGLMIFSSGILLPLHIGDYPWTGHPVPETCGRTEGLAATIGWFNPKKWPTFLTVMVLCPRSGSVHLGYISHMRLNVPLVPMWLIMIFPSENGTFEEKKTDSWTDIAFGVRVLQHHLWCHIVLLCSGPSL